MKYRNLACAVMTAMIVAGASPDAMAKKVRIKLGTLAPEGSVWMNVLTRMGQRWKTASKGQVVLKIYPGGVAGDELDMVRKMRIGQLHAGCFTGVGLSEISKAHLGLQIPMMFDSWAQLDYVRDRVAPRIESDMEAVGFVMLQWGDAGWVHKFSKDPAVTPADYKPLKLFVLAGQTQAEALWREGGFHPVPLSTIDVLGGLKTGMIDAFGTTPLFALTSQWFGVAKHMVAVNWTPLNGGTVVSKAMWDQIDPALQPELRKIATEEGVGLRQAVRELNEKAIDAMVDRGLKVVRPDAATKAQWRAIAKQTYPAIRGTIVPEADFDQIQKLATEYAKKQTP